MCLEGYERYADNVCINEYQALDLLSALCKTQSKTLKHVNLGGNIWPRDTLLKYIKYLFPLPALTTAILPVDGLGADSLKQYFFAKMADVSCLPPLDIGEYGSEFRELKVAAHMRLKADLAVVNIRTKAVRDGAQFVIVRDPSGVGKRRAMKAAKEKAEDPAVKKELVRRKKAGESPSRRR